MLVIPYKPVHVLLFSQLRLKGNAKHYGNHLPKEITEEKHVPVTEGIREKNFGFHIHFLSTSVIC